MNARSLTRYLVTYQLVPPSASGAMAAFVQTPPVQALIIEAESRVQAYATFYETALCNGQTVNTEDLTVALDAEEREELLNLGLPIHPGAFQVQGIQAYGLQARGRAISQDQLSRELARRIKALGESEPPKALAEPQSFLDLVTSIFEGDVLPLGLEEPTESKSQVENIPSQTSSDEDWYQSPAAEETPEPLPCRPRRRRARPKE